MPTVLYGCEIWNNLKQRDKNELNIFQWMVAKKIQGFHPYVRTDMCEPMVGLMRLQAEVDRRKLLFLRSLCDMSYNSVPNRIVHFKLLIFLDHAIDSEFTADICSILSRYNLLDHLTQYAKTLVFPGKQSWKRVVSSAISHHELNLWQERVNLDNDFIRFRQLQFTISPATIYSTDKIMKDRATIIM